MQLQRLKPGDIYLLIPLARQQQRYGATLAKRYGAQVLVHSYPLNQIKYFELLRFTRIVNSLRPILWTVGLVRPISKLSREYWLGKKFLDGKIIINKGNFRVHRGSMLYKHCVIVWHPYSNTDCFILLMLTLYVPLFLCALFDSPIFFDRFLTLVL